MRVTLWHCLLLLTPHERGEWAGLIPLALIAALLETCGAAAAFALITVLSDPTQASALPVLKSLFTQLPPQTERAIVLVCTGLLVLFFVVKNALLAVIAYAQGRVASNSTAALSRRMFAGYLAAPYSYHFQRNSSVLIRNTTYSVHAAVHLVMSAAVQIVTETLVLAGIVAVLMAAAPWVTAGVAVLLAAMLTVLLRLTRRSVVRWGMQEQELQQEILQSLQQGLGGIKEVKVLGREQFFYEGFASRQDALARIRYLAHALAAMPRLLVETVFVSALLFVVMWASPGGALAPALVPLLGLYAYAGFRVIPSVNRIVLQLNCIRTASSAVRQLHDDVEAFRPTGTHAFDGAAGAAREEVAFTERIVLDHVSYEYDGVDAPVLRDISLTIQRGESIGIVGATGAGKSTLVDLLLGLLAPSQGRITVDGRDVSRSLRAWQRKIGYVPQTPFLIDDSLRRNIAFGRLDAEIDEQRVRTVIRLAQLERFLADLPDGLETVVGERGVRLSGGERQRIAIARALYDEPEVLVFDEATSSLDNATEQDVVKTVEALRGSKTILIVAHRLSTVRRCDRLMFLERGGVAAVGPFDELLADNAEFRSLVALADLGGSPL